MENSFAEKDLQILMNSKLRTSQKCTLAMKKVNFMLGCIKKSIDSKSREVISQFHSVGTTAPGALCPVLAFLVLERVQWRATKVGGT